MRRSQRYAREPLVASECVGDGRARRTPQPSARAATSSPSLAAATATGSLLGGFGEKGGQALDFESRSLDHRLQIGDEFRVHGIVGRAEVVERR